MAEEGNFQQMVDIWAHVLPKEQLKRILETDPQETEKRHKGRKYQNKASQEETGQAQLIKAMAALLLRHEDSIKCLNLDMEYMVHLNQGPGSILGSLMAASKEWTNAKAEEKDSSIAAPLGGDNDRYTATEIHSSDRSPARERTSSTSPAIPALGQHQSLSLSLLESREKAADQIEDTTNAAGRGFQDDPRDQNMLGRLPSNLEVPQLEEDVHRNGQSSPLWTVSHRVAPNLWHLLQRLAFHSSWQLIQVHLRPANLQRSPLAKTIHQHLGKP
eukprot:symbB.v1.2.032327.t1/scaffold3864.1/size52931/1